MPLPVAALVCDERHVAAHVVGEHAEAVELLLGLAEVGVGQVDLVDGDDDATRRRPWRG